MTWRCSQACLLSVPITLPATLPACLCAQAVVVEKRAFGDSLGGQSPCVISLQPLIMLLELAPAVALCVAQRAPLLATMCRAAVALQGIYLQAAPAAGVQAADQV